MKKQLFKPLENRIRILIVSTYLTIPLILMLAAFNPQLVSPKNLDILILASYVFLGLNIAQHLTVIFWPKTKRFILDFLILLDTLYITFIVYLSGETTSPFVFLFYIQVVAVMICISYRTGLKTVILQTIIFLALYYQQYTGFISYSSAHIPRIKIVGSHYVWHLKTMLNIIFLWIIAATAAFFSSINERELKQSNKELAMLNKTSLNIEKSSSQRSILLVIAKAVIEKLEFNSIVMLLINREKRIIEKTVSFGLEEKVKKYAQKLKLPLKNKTLPILMKVINSKQPVGGQIKNIEKKSPLLAQVFTGQKQFIAIPLTGYYGVVGVMIATKKGYLWHSRIKDREVDVLYTLGKQAAIAIDNTNLHKKLRAMAKTDSLTGLYNHGSFQEKLDSEINRVKRYKNLSFEKNPLSLIMIDLDNFKRYNDHFGHQAGDVILKLTANILKKSCRFHDFACRYGGEEFSIILPNTDKQQSKIIAERIRKSIRNLESENVNILKTTKKTRITCSIGIVTAYKKNCTKVELINKADQALYFAKNKGKNQAVHYYDMKQEELNLREIS